jgi:Mycothiol maleylpyruvate isomerase N-terminal domain
VQGDERAGAEAARESDLGAGDGQGEVGEAREEALERDGGLDAGEPGPEAIVDAGAKGEVAVRLAVNVQPLGILEDAGIGVGGGEAGEEHPSAARPRALIARCSDADLARPMPAGWTVAGVLGHLAFWDQRIIELLARWEASGVAPNQEVEADVDWISDAGKPLILAVPPRKAAELAVAIAEAADRRVEMLSDDFVARNAAAGSPLNLSRADHRREHLDDIERALKG